MRNQPVREAMNGFFWWSKILRKLIEWFFYPLPACWSVSLLWSFLQTFSSNCIIPHFVCLNCICIELEIIFVQTLQGIIFYGVKIGSKLKDQKAMEFPRTISHSGLILKAFTQKEVNRNKYFCYTFHNYLYHFLTRYWSFKK